MKENKLAELSMEFSVDIINLVGNLKKIGKPLFLTKSAEVVQASVPTSTKHSMHKARRILFLSWKLP